MGDGYKTIWSSSSSTNIKEWGSEIEIGTLNTIKAKIICINAGKQTSLKYYNIKDEILFVQSGKIFVEFDSEKYHFQDKDRPLKTMTLVTGDVLYVQSMCPYRISAIEHSKIIEIGSGTNSEAVKITRKT